MIGDSAPLAAICNMYLSFEKPYNVLIVSLVWGWKLEPLYTSHIVVGGCLLLSRGLSGHLAIAGPPSTLACEENIGLKRNQVTIL